MDFEDFLCTIYIPIKTIEIFTDMVFVKSNEEWNMFGKNVSNNSAQELLGINFAIKLCAKELLKYREEEIKKIKNFQ